jgi:TRAP-type mannitol/chloroaromatic compound transport system permease small subunit
LERTSLALTDFLYPSEPRTRLLLEVSMIEFLGTIFFGLLPLVLMVVIGLLSMACITDWWKPGGGSLF